MAERNGIADLFANLRPRSKAAVDAAVRFRTTPHVNATLVITIPDDPGKPCEMAVFTGPVILSVETWKM
jgi:hypothetical protein